MKSYLLQVSNILDELPLHSVKLTPLHRKDQHPARAWDNQSVTQPRDRLFVRIGGMCFSLFL